MHRNTIYKASEQKSSNLQRKTLKDLQRRTIAREHFFLKKYKVWRQNVKKWGWLKTFVMFLMS